MSSNPDPDSKDILHISGSQKATHSTRSDGGNPGSGTDIGRMPFWPFLRTTCGGSAGYSGYRKLRSGMTSGSYGQGFFSPCVASRILLAVFDERVLKNSERAAVLLQHSVINRKHGQKIARG